MLIAGIILSAVLLIIIIRRVTDARTPTLQDAYRDRCPRCLRPYSQSPPDWRTHIRWGIPHPQDCEKYKREPYEPHAKDVVWPRGTGTNSFGPN